MPARTTTWFASDFTAEDPPRNDPRLTGSSALPKGPSSAADEWPPATEEAVRRDQVGDLPADHRRRDPGVAQTDTVARERVDIHEFAGRPLRSTWGAPPGGGRRRGPAPMSRPC